MKTIRNSDYRTAVGARAAIFDERLARQRRRKSAALDSLWPFAVLSYTSPVLWISGLTDLFFDGV